MSLLFDMHPGLFFYGKYICPVSMKGELHHQNGCHLSESNKVFLKPFPGYQHSPQRFMSPMDNPSLNDDMRINTVTGQILVAAIERQEFRDCFGGTLAHYSNLVTFSHFKQFSFNPLYLWSSFQGFLCNQICLKGFLLRNILSV